MSSTKIKPKYTFTDFVTNQPLIVTVTYEGWNFNSGNYLFKTDTK